MTIAVVSYSLTGITQRVADAVAQDLGASVATIAAPNIKPGGFAMFRLGMATVMRWKTGVSLSGEGIAGCDTVILASPVWAGQVSVPMRSWLATGPLLPQRVGLILTGRAPEAGASVFADFARMAGVTPVAQLYVAEQAVRSGAISAQVTAFCHSVRA